MRFTQLVGTLAFAIAIIVIPMAWADSEYSVLYNFADSRNGGPPLATPALDANGNLYGPAAGGTGNSNYCNGPCGVIYGMTRGGDGKWTESVALNVSTYYNGGWPDSPLVFDRFGSLYGSLSSYWFFQMTPKDSGWAFDLIYEGYGTDVGGVILDGAGNLYGELGVESEYRTTVGELSPGSAGWVYTNLYNFCEKENCPDGAEPRAPFSWDSRGNLYGTDYAGGLPCSDGYGCGAAFQMAPNQDGTWAYHVMHRFGSFKTDGFYPWGGLVVDGEGNAYGTTYEGGPHGHGTVFKLKRTSGGKWQETMLYGFPNVSLGAYPWGDLVLDKSGNLYGVANGGNTCGSYFCGEVFKLTPQKNGEWKYSVLHSFKGSDGAYPYGVVIDKQGNLFGTASSGGKYNTGVVFEITP
ncbi:MAG TPA: choice-of-anchor tandem repeat GloVer-containing protein [Terriglobales bacterium]|nr:choice-of-anchor tandem repeat GloVer-containing protein [Terriglobales bacterium]